MTHPLDARQIADIIRSAPAYARLGLSMRSQRHRDLAADYLAATICGQLVSGDQLDRDQLALPL